jgi:hypothetical protein
MNNKLLDFIERQRKLDKNSNYYYPHPNDPSRYDNNEEKLKVKRAEEYSRIKFEAFCDISTFCLENHLRFNELNDLKAVVYGKVLSQNINLPPVNVLMIMTSENILIFEQIKPNLSSGLASFFSIGKVAKNPFKETKLEFQEVSKFNFHKDSIPMISRISVRSGPWNELIGTDLFLLEEWNRNFEILTKAKNSTK